MADPGFDRSPHATTHGSRDRLLISPARFTPGIALCVAVTLVSMGVQAVAQAFTGQAYLEALVIAILLGVAVRAVWTPKPSFLPGIAFSAKPLLEVAVVLLGAAVSIGTVWALGPELLLGIVGVVTVALGTSYGIGRVFGLKLRLAILVACGNSICGNSAIAAVAPVIGADGDEVASSIAFTAVLGVVTVLVLPSLVSLLALSLTQYGVVAELTVYGVPQVLAATLPIGELSNQVGTVVKLVRVLMLGPVVIGLSLALPRLRAGGAARVQITQLIPWFIVGFLLMLALRSLGWIPEAAISPVKSVTSLLTTVSMAALGLGVELRVVAQAGIRVVAAVTVSLLVLVVISVGLIRLLGLP